MLMVKLALTRPYTFIGMAMLIVLGTPLWSLGVSTSLVIFDGGRIKANVDFSRSGYAVTVANYRRVVLTALQEVQGGIANYLDVMTAQQSLLNSERQASQLLGQRLVTTVVLIKALGGGWQVQVSAAP